MPHEPSKPIRSTPGAYLARIEALGSGIVGVATALPVFIGYTQFAGDPATGEPLYLKPVAVASLGEFTARFGGPAVPHYAVAPVAPPATPDFTALFTTAGPDFEVEYGGFTLAPAGGEEPARFNLYWQLCLFFANGGGSCVVVSVGSYWADRFPTEAPGIVPGDWVPGAIRAGSAAPMAGLLGGLAAAGEAVGPTIIVIPEACQLGPGDYASVAAAMLEQAGTLADRVAILDLPDCMAATTIDALRAAQEALWTAIALAASHLSYGVAYAPALQAAIVADEDVLYTSLVAGAEGDNGMVNDLLTTQAVQSYQGEGLASVQAAIAAAFPLDASFGTGNGPRYSLDASAYPPFDPARETLQAWQGALNRTLLDALPLLGTVLRLVAAAMNVAPPSGALAGVWAACDAEAGLWSAPANIALAQVSAPICLVNDDQQPGFTTPLNGMAIDIIRAQMGRGAVVWGARTLDGNSDDYRYIQVRRTIIYVRQSIATALRAYADAPNDRATWAAVTAAISDFLTTFWQQGGLVGTTASEAFTVSCGLGLTMTPDDLLEGRMTVAVNLAISHPAEYIMLSVVQSMTG